MAKFEAVLEADASNRGVLRNCAFALYDLARLQPDPVSRATRQLLEVRDTPNVLAQVQVLTVYSELIPTAPQNTVKKFTGPCLAQ